MKEEGEEGALFKLLSLVPSQLKPHTSNLSVAELKSQGAVSENVLPKVFP